MRTIEQKALETDFLNGIVDIESSGSLGSTEQQDYVCDPCDGCSQSSQAYPSPDYH